MVMNAESIGPTHTSKMAHLQNVQEAVVDAVIGHVLVADAGIVLLWVGLRMPQRPVRLMFMS